MASGVYCEVGENYYWYTNNLDVHEGSLLKGIDALKMYNSNLLPTGKGFNCTEIANLTAYLSRCLGLSVDVARFGSHTHYIVGFAAPGGNLYYDSSFGRFRLDLSMYLKQMAWDPEEPTISRWA